MFRFIIFKNNCIQFTVLSYQKLKKYYKLNQCFNIYKTIMEISFILSNEIEVIHYKEKCLPCHYTVLFLNGEKSPNYCKKFMVMTVVYTG